MMAPNAGGSSRMSEAYSYELLSALLGGRIWLDKTEAEIVYRGDKKGAITDYSFRTFTDERIGVSVTRACGQEFDSDAAKKLLLKKLAGVNESSARVEKDDAWKKQVLHVWCESDGVAQLMTESYENEIPLKAKADTYVLISVVDHNRELFYSSEESANIMRHGAIKLGSVKGIFHKEIALRPSYDAEPTLSEAALVCRSHSFFGDPLGGLKCQVCSFETTNRVWKCKRCDVVLCGSCMDKWKSKINK